MHDDVIVPAGRFRLENARGEVGDRPKNPSGHRSGELDCFGILALPSVVGDRPDNGRIVPFVAARVLPGLKARNAIGIKGTSGFPLGRFTQAPEYSSRHFLVTLITVRR